jgi:hypothetical protein
MDGILLSISTLDTPTRWLIIIAVLLTIFYAVMRPMRKKKDPLARSTAAPSLASQRAVERDMTQLLVELSEMARQVTAQLDTRTKKLELLLKEADEKIAILKDASRNIPAAAGGNGSSAPLAPGSVPLPLQEIDKRHLEVYELSDQKLSSQQIASKLSRPRGEIDLILALRESSVH